MDVDFGMVLAALFYFLVPIALLQMPAVIFFGRRCRRRWRLALVSGCSAQ